MRRSVTIAIIAVLAAAAPALAGFPGTDLFLPSVGARPGVPPAVWYTTVWVHNPNTTQANVTFYLLERQANLAPRAFTDTIPAGDTRRYDNAVKTMFGVETFGAIRLTADVKLLAGARIYSQSGALDDSVGQYFAGLPAAFSIGSGQSTELTGVWQTQPAADSTFRYNFGFVETTGTGTCQVRVTLKDATGAAVESKTYTVRQWEQLQKGFKDEFPTRSTDNARLTVEVLSGTGRVLAFGSSVANGSQDPATVEMAFRDELLGGGPGGLAEVTHDATLTGAGTVASPLGLANNAVTTGKIADDAVTSEKIANGTIRTADLAAAAVTQANLFVGGAAAAGKVLGTTGNGLVWQTASGGGDITAVNAGVGLTGGGQNGDVVIGIKAAGVTSSLLADNAVTAAKIDATGIAAGKVLKATGASTAAWSDDATGALTLPLVAPPQSHTGALIEISNSGSGPAVKLGAVLNNALYAENDSSSKAAIQGLNKNDFRDAIGVWGAAQGAGIGVQGGSSSGKGVYGWVYTGTGVWGTSQSGTSGVYGEVGSGTGYGVKGTYSTSGSSRWGYLGGADGAAGGKVLSGNVPAVKAESASGVALYATSNGSGGTASVAVKAEQTHAHGIAIHAINGSDDVNLLLSNYGTGPLIKAYSFHGGSSGDLELLVDATGNVRADGTFSSPAADFAELLPAREGLEPGDVLAIDVDGKLIRSVEAYQASVAGVYSTRPAFLGGQAIEGDPERQVPLAVVGVVPVKASAENGPIRPGDMLVASSTPGHAMRAGTRAPNGCVIGKALGRLDAGTGIVTMLVILQ